MPNPHAAPNNNNTRDSLGGQAPSLVSLTRKCSFGQVVGQ
jgi:hypothetical protein